MNWGVKYGLSKMQEMLGPGPEKPGELEFKYENHRQALILIEAA